VVGVKNKSLARRDYESKEYSIETWLLVSRILMELIRSDYEFKEYSVEPEVVGVKNTQRI